MKLAELVGQCLVLGISGTRITSDIVRHFQELHAGGLILYRRNFVSPGQLQKLVVDLEEALGRRLLVAVDHEGGRVIMFREAVTVFPDNLALGATAKIEYARQQGEIEARELRRLGMDVNLAPVLDVLTAAYSPNIGIRSYGRDWRLAAEMGVARIAAMQQGGLSACAKHFPGKGHAPVDAHLGLPVINSTWQEMRDVHLQPFVAAIRAGVHLVMSSHPYYPNLDPYPGMIATFSRRIIHDCLRRELNFSGVIVSDDLEMGAVKALCPIGEAGVMAAAAGHDLLLVCHQPQAQKEVQAHLLAAYHSRQLPVADLEARVARINNLKARRDARFVGGEPAVDPAGPPLAAHISREAVRVLRDDRRLLPLGRGPGKVAVLFPQFASLAANIMIEPDLLPEKDFVRREFARFGLQPEVFIVPLEPAPPDLQHAVDLARRADLTVCFCYDAHLYPAQKRLLDALQAAAPNLVVDLLRDPYDADFLHPTVTCLTAFGWRACQLRAAIETMCAAAS